ncbi:hypothetical protein [Alicyclobacillus sp. SP_1]|jgi:photosystem II stability/assembly factor-like uncharacterized protein|uniref:WD40/YVTN/BNR-like repeat-containing protein n=1 Tax=Alicyclobacillus sp. SP_1 TaxID=2942475 RepID=UPI002157F191|nr:hypothetical protein [Alicyclobacillus sp. SP_1]
MKRLYGWKTRLTICTASTIVTGLAVAWAAPSTVEAAPLSLDTTVHYTYAHTTMTFNTHPLTVSAHIVARDPWSGRETSWLPVYYLNQALLKLGLTPHWNGTTGVWTIGTGSASTASSQPSPASAPNARTALLYVNGKLVETSPRMTEPDPYSGRPTTYLPIFYIMQVLDHLQINSYWHGDTWTMTSTTHHFVEGLLHFNDLQMLSPETGWAQTDHHLWRTVNGARTWTNVTPIGYSGSRADITRGKTGFSSFQTMGRNDAWIVETATSNSPATVLYTTNGGVSWNSSTPIRGFSSESSGLLDFVSPTVGYLYEVLGSSMGAEAIGIWRSTDGGANWSLVSSAKLGSGGNIPFSGNKNGISFVNSTTGWLSGSYNSGKKPFFERTTDGGQQWSAQSISIPSKIDSNPFSVYPPRFFGQQDGILPVGFNDELDVEHTTDGGSTWTPGPVQTLDSSGNSNVSIRGIQFLSPTLGFAWTTDYHFHSGSNGHTLFRTTNGGQSWTEMDNVQGYRHVLDVNFINTEDGFMLANQHLGYPTTLLETTNGGRTWTEIRPTASKG